LDSRPVFFAEGTRMRRILLAAAATAILLLPACERATSGKDSGKSEARTDGTLAQALAGADDGRFLAAVRAAGLEPTLSGPAPFTVLAPSNAAFDKMPAGSLDALMKPEARGELTGVLSYHFLPGVVLAEDLGRAIDKAKGKAVIATMGGETVTATRDGDAIVLTDGAGGKARITRADDKRSNGVVHRIDSVLMPG
jgi:uncharacterized surface protein with fasciclin (FAS1) repeats